MSKVTIGTGKKIGAKQYSGEGTPSLEQETEGQENSRDAVPEAAPQTVITVSPNAPKKTLTSPVDLGRGFSAAVRDDGNGINVDFGDKAQDPVQAMKDFLADEYGLESGGDYTITQDKDGNAHFNLKQEDFERFVNDKTPELTEKLGLGEETERSQSTERSQESSKGKDAPKSGKEMQSERLKTQNEALSKLEDRKDKKVSAFKSITDGNLTTEFVKPQNAKQWTGAVLGGTVGAAIGAPIGAVKEGLQGIGSGFAAGYKAGGGGMIGLVTGAIGAVLGCVKGICTGAWHGAKAGAHVGERFGVSGISALDALDDKRMISNTKQAIKGTERATPENFEKSANAEKEVEESRTRQHTAKHQEKELSGFSKEVGKVAELQKNSIKAQGKFEDYFEQDHIKERYPASAKLDPETLMKQSLNGEFGKDAKNLAKDAQKAHEKAGMKDQDGHTRPATQEDLDRTLEVGRQTKESSGIAHDKSEAARTTKHTAQGVSDTFNKGISGGMGNKHQKAFDGAVSGLKDVKIEEAHTATKQVRGIDPVKTQDKGAQIS